MRAGDGERLHAEVASVLDWWTLAGATSAVAETPRDWLAPVKAPPAVAAVPVASGAEALPATLDDFLAWLAAGDPELLGPADARLMPAGDRAAKLMVLVDIPAPEDGDAGMFMSGPAGRLLDRMLAAIGTARDAVWLAPLVPARPAGARVAGERLKRLGAVARHHAALAAPERLLLMGAATAEAVLDLQIGAARGRVHDIGGRRTIATFSPQVLLGAPAMKAGAWADLRQLLEGAVA